MNIDPLHLTCRERVYGRAGSIMHRETPEFELTRLRRLQSKARQDEVFGGLSPEERLTYNNRQNRIHELERVESEQRDEYQPSPVGSRKAGSRNGGSPRNGRH